MADCSVESLYCKEEVEELEGGSEVRAVVSARAEVPVFLEDDEAVVTLVRKEVQFMPEGNYAGRYRALELSGAARLEAVRWIQKVQSFYNYGSLTLALAVNYMDRFLSRHHLPEGKEWMLQLLSVACISLAAKMEESDVPILLDLQIEKAEHVFEAHTIQRMELLVLTTLDWRMSVVTPFSYIDHFLHKLGARGVLLRALLARVGEIVVKATKDTTFLPYRPSVVAAAAITCALEEVTTTLQSQTDLLRIFASLSVDVDAVLECYDDMQELVMDSHYLKHMKRKALMGKAEPQSPVGILEAASSDAVFETVATTLRFKRRKLNLAEHPNNNNSIR